MSWIEKIETDFTITCGDGQSYTPNWLRAGKIKEYNVATFEFRDLAGTLVKRTMPKGRRYTIEIYFQGENHLDVTEAFEKSADDPRPWTISHPLYGSILVQPLSITFDNEAYNVSKLTIPVIETIEDEQKPTTSPADKIAEDKAAADEALANTYEAEVQPKASDVQNMKSNLGQMYEKGKNTVTNTLDQEAYFNAFNTASSFIDNAISAPGAAIRQMQNIINLPAQFADSVNNRINTLITQLDTLIDSIGGSATRNEKKLFENNAGTTVTALAEATVTDYTVEDYANRTQVLGVIDKLVASYDKYITKLDSLQSLNGGSPDSYIPNAEAIIALSQLVSYTIGSLFTIANGSKQERIIYMAEDTNIIVLTHKLYGLLPDDSTIDELLRNNPDISDSELLGLEKGRRIVYYK